MRPKASKSPPQPRGEQTFPEAGQVSLSGDQSPLTPGAVWFQLCLGAVTAAATAGLLYLFWGHLGLPDRPEVGLLAAEARPQGLRLFVAGAPLAVLLPSLVLGVLVLMLPHQQDDPRNVQWRRLLTLDAWTYLLLPLLALLPWTWQLLGAGFLALGLWFLGAMSLKTILLVRILWLGFLAPSARGFLSPLKRQLAVFLVAGVCLSLGAVWVSQALSTASDEVAYLTFTHSLIHHGTLDPAPTVAAKSYGAYYWARWSDALAPNMDVVHAWLFPWILSPAYGVAGRLGVLVLLALFTALAMSQLLAWLEEIGLPPGPSAAAVGITFTSAPLFFLSQQVFPDVTVILVLVVGLRLLTRVSQGPAWAALGLVVVALLLGGIKSRFMPVGAGFLALGAWELGEHFWGKKKTALILAGLLALAGLVLWLVPMRSWPYVIFNFLDNTLYATNWAEHLWSIPWIFFRGLGFDQTYGVFMVAPALLLILAGLPAGLRDHPRPACHALVVAASYLAAVCLSRWFQWYGGFSAPGRFAAVALPGMALFLALGLHAFSRPWLRLVVWIPALLGLAYTWLGTLAPQLRYARPLGVNPLVRALQEALDVPLHHLLPSTFTISPLLDYWLVGLLLLAGAAARWTWRFRPPASPATGSIHRETLAMVVILVGGAALWVQAALWFPPSFLEAEQMKRKGGQLFAEYAYPDYLRGVVLLDKNWVEAPLYFPGEPVSLSFRGQASAEGHLLIQVEPRSWEVSWHDQPQVAVRAQFQRVVDLGPVTRGRHKLRVTWLSCPKRECDLLLDHIQLRREK